MRIRIDVDDPSRQSLIPKSQGTGQIIRLVQGALDTMPESMVKGEIREWPVSNYDGERIGTIRLESDGSY